MRLAVVNLKGGTGYAHLVLDTPPGDPAIVRSALLAGEVALLPIPPSLMDLNRLRPTLELLAEVEPLNPLGVQVLLTRVRRASLERAFSALKERLPQLPDSLLKRSREAEGWEKEELKALRAK